MELATLLTILIVVDHSSVDWGMKEISLPAEKARIRFSAYTMSKDSQLTVREANIMWIPKIEAFPGDPARQCLRISLRHSDGRGVEIVQVPSTSGNPVADIMRITSQGYLGNILTNRSSHVYLKRGNTCIGLLSEDFDFRDLRELTSALIRINANFGSHGSKKPKYRNR